MCRERSPLSQAEQWPLEKEKRWGQDRATGWGHSGPRASWGPGLGKV